MKGERNAALLLPQSFIRSNKYVLTDTLLVETLKTPSHQHSTEFKTFHVMVCSLLPIYSLIDFLD